ncbi:MAG: metallophosphoesterase family protein [bacterium]|nr:metallophosphoesterase family protein [bacterium]
MLIAIAADLHDNRLNWQKFNDYAAKQGIKILLFCGDLATADTLAQIQAEFDGTIYLIAGNAETYEAEKIKNNSKFFFIGRYGHLTIAGKRIGLIHEPSFKRDLLSEQTDLNYIFYGHTHKPWIEQEGNIIVANPGTLGGVNYQASFAVLDTETNNLTLVILENI